MRFTFGSLSLAFLATASPINNSTSFNGIDNHFPQLSSHYQEELTRYATFAAIAYCSQYPQGLTVGELQMSCGDSYFLCTEQSPSVEVVQIYRGEVTAVIFKDDARKEILWVPKGTTTDAEWALNFNTKPKPYMSLASGKRVCNGCMVHNGFYKGAREVWQSMSEGFLQLVRENPEYQISVTGHSLGGALAVLLANELKLMGYNVKLVTYGQPKVGTFRTVDWMDQFWGLPPLNNPNGILPNAMVRVTNKGDVVPFVPLTTMGFGHAGMEIYFRNGYLPTDMSQAVVRGKWSFERSKREELGVSNIVLRTGPTKLIHNSYFVHMNQCMK